MYLFKLSNVFVQIVKCICSNWKLIFLTNMCQAVFVLRPRKQVDVKSFLREIRHNSTIFSFSHPKVNINGPLFVQLKFSMSMQTDIIQQCGWKCWNKVKRERKLTQSATFDNSDYLPKVFLCLDVKRLKGIFWIVSTLIVEIFFEWLGNLSKFKALPKVTVSQCVWVTSGYYPLYPLGVMGCLFVCLFVFCFGISSLL